MPCRVTNCAEPLYKRTGLCRRHLQDYKNAWKSADYAKHPEKYRRWALGSTLRNVYKISIDDYNYLYKAQDGRCAICLSSAASQVLDLSNNEKLAIDHDHSNGLVRGLLCSDCNTGLARFKDATVFLQRAIDYLNNSTLLHHFVQGPSESSQLMPPGSDQAAGTPPEEAYQGDC